ncbi:MAG: hypothetical protein JXR73_20945 [Candidatus Omnitrophica bacterium]|nr:hypothetical protein [Candidatus Omnitrophota bacterium]
MKNASVIRLTFFFATAFLWIGCSGSILPTRQTATLVSDQENITRQIEIPANVKILEFHHAGGDLSIVGWDQPYILIEGVIRASAETVNMARAIIEMVEVVAYERPTNRLVLEYEGPAGFARGKIPEEGMDYTAKVPRGMILDVYSENGAVSVSNIKNDLFVEQKEGNVRVNSISGSVLVKAAGKKKAGQKVEIASIERRLTLNSRFVDVTLSKVQGDAELRHSDGELIASDIDGKLTVQGGKSPIQLNRIQGFIQLDNHVGDVVCNGFYDGIRAEVKKGALLLAPKVPVVRPYDCQVIDGNLTFRIPDNSSMMMELMAINGSIHSEFPMQVSAEGKVSYAKGAIGQGQGFPMVRLNVDDGGIMVLRDIPVPASTRSSAGGDSFAPKITTEGAIPVGDLESTAVE